jgi:hypothetical protein
VDGSEKLQPLIIGKAKSPCAFNKKTGAQLGFYYCHNAKAWMTSDIYQEFLHQWDNDLRQKNRKILLLQDNFSGHIVPNNLQNIHVENFTANLTAHVQPLDQGIIHCFKGHYREKYIHRAIDRYDSGITPLKIYDINQLEAMCLANLAWNEVDTTTIRNCWHKAAILPSMGNSPLLRPTIPISSLILDPTRHEDPINQVEKAVAVALDDLVATGALQAGNRMDIESLLNPTEESQNMQETSEEDIFDAVMECRNAREDEPITGGDDVDDTSPCKPPPSRCEVLQAALIINRFVQNIDDPLARRVEAVLGSLGRQTCYESQCDKVDSKITDFFKRPQSI